MLELAPYRVVERQSSPGAFDVIDAATGQVVAIASSTAVPAVKSGPESAVVAWLLGYRFFQILLALIGLPIFLAKLLSGRGLLPSKESRPRLVVRRVGDDEVICTVRQSSGFMYDSRRVYDSQGGLIAQFRSRSMTTVRGGFGIIDLRGMADDWSDIGDRPWLGVVEAAGELFRVHLVVHRDAARIVLREPPGIAGATQQPARTARGECDVEADMDLRDEPTSKVVVLAVALTLAWWATS